MLTRLGRTDTSFVLHRRRAKARTAEEKAAVAAAKELEKQQKKEARERARQEKAAQKYGHVYCSVPLPAALHSISLKKPIPAMTAEIMVPSHA